MTARQRFGGLLIGTFWGALLGGWAGLMVGSVYLLAPGLFLGLLTGALIGSFAPPRVAVGTLIGYLVCGTVVFLLLAGSGMKSGRAGWSRSTSRR